MAKLARGMTVQTHNFGKHYAFCVRCNWMSSKYRLFETAKSIAISGCPRCSEEESMSYRDLTFEDVSMLNAERANRWHRGFPNSDDGWTGADWSNAAAGEGGEMVEAVQALLLSSGATAHLGLAGNVVKKLRRIDISIQQAEQGQEEDKAYEATLLQKLATEIGDTFIYLDLLAQFYGLKMHDCVANTFNRVSDREGFPEIIVGTPNG